jgi:hypothetical protein
MKLKRLQLSSDLPDWRPSDTSGYASNAKRLRKLAAKAGSDGYAFQKACDRLKACVSGREVGNCLVDSIHVRAYAYLLSSDDLFVKDNYPRSEALQCIREQRWPLGRLTLTNLVRVFANNIDKRSADETNTLGYFLNEALREMPRTLAGDLKLMQTNGADIFDSEGPKRLAVNAVALGLDLTEYLRKVGLVGFKVSAFVRLSFHHYFIQQLENLRPGEDSPVLAELRKPEVHMAVLGEGQLLGHRALEILIDRTPDSGPSDAWQKAVVGIAGDPRVGWRSKSFQDWWQFLGDARARKVVGWLSRLDLKIFLEVLEASARTTNTESIRRMYPPRKKFMEGLLEQGMVLQSRLFLSRDASMYLRSNYDADDVPEHAVITSGHTSVIYLELTGGLHMVEGTDNMKIKILDALPSRPQILNFLVRRFNDTDFRADLIRTYIRDQNAKNRSLVLGKDYIDQAHSAIAWQASAISLFNKRGIKYDASKFFSNSDYRLFKTSYSRSYWS